MFFYDYSSCQASLNLPLISLAYLLKGKRYTPGESPKFGIESFMVFQENSEGLPSDQFIRGDMTRHLLFSAFC